MSIAAIAVVSLCLSSSDWYPIDLSSYNSNAREPGCCVDKQSIIHFSLPASHDNSGCSKHLLRWLLTVLPFSQSLTPHSTHDLPTSMSTIPCQSSLHYYLCFHGNQASKERECKRTPAGGQEILIPAFDSFFNPLEATGRPSRFEARKTEVEVSWRIPTADRPI
jgi:hypothetical protein